MRLAQVGSGTNCAEKNCDVYNSIFDVAAIHLDFFISELEMKALVFLSGLSPGTQKGILSPSR